MKVIKEELVAGKKVLLRADLDGPVQRLGKGRGWESLDEAGLETTLPTIKFLRKAHAKTIIIGHLDRPKGKVVEKLRIDPVAKKLDEHIKGIRKVDDCVGVKIKTAAENMDRSDILLLENLRFHPEEEANDPEFAQKLASLAELYVNDCFADSHRKHTSIVGVPKYLPSFAGLQFAKEIEVLSQILKNPERPLVFIMGGAKTETKIPLVKKLSKIADTILLGGLLMFARELEGVPKTRFPMDSIRIDDIGPKSIDLFGKILDKAKTIVWNGPMGKFEEGKFAQGTKAIAEILAEKAQKNEAQVIVGGGDTVTALDKFEVSEKMSFVSTGGGAMLQYLAEGTLPGIEALK